MSLKDTQTTETIDLVEITRNLLKNRPRWMSYTRIEKDTGLKAAWLNSFANYPHEPSATKLIKLYEYLSGNKIKIA